jgi:uncharacterized membrane protein YciS (DUF1049 family)
VIVLSVAAGAETLIHFVPAAGTGLKAIATPLAFVAGTLLMAVPLGDKNPLYQWTLAAVLGGGLATLTHLGVTGMRAMTAPANAASLGVFGLVWNCGEVLVSVLLAALGGICVIVGWVLGAVFLFVIFALALIVVIKTLDRWTRRQPVKT